MTGRTAARLLQAADVIEHLAGDGAVTAKNLRQEAADVVFADQAEEVARNAWADAVPCFSWEALNDHTRAAMIAAVHAGRRISA